MKNKNLIIWYANAPLLSVDGRGAFFLFYTIRFALFQWHKLREEGTNDKITKR